MSDQTPVVEDQPTIDPVDQPEVVETTEEDKVKYSSYKKVLDEKKAMQKRLSEFEAQQKAKDEAKLVEDGKLKELLEMREKELAELSPYQKEADDYRGYFEKRLEEAKEGLTEVQLKAVDGFAGSLSDKLAMAEEFKGSSPMVTSSPGSDRPGTSSSPKFDLSEYLGPGGNEKLTKLYYSNRPLYDEVIRAKNNRQ